MHRAARLLVSHIRLVWTAASAMPPASRGDYLTPVLAIWNTSDSFARVLIDLDKLIYNNLAESDLCNARHIWRKSTCMYYSAKLRAVF